MLLIRPGMMSESADPQSIETNQEKIDYRFDQDNQFQRYGY